MARTASSARAAASSAARKTAPWVARLARVGYVTKGVVYLIIGVLAVQAAFGSGGETTGSQGALRQIAEQPFGQVLLILTAIGLLGYALWRFVEATVDPEGHGTDAKGIVKRVGYVVSGVAHLALAGTAASIVFGWGSSGEGDAKQEWTARLLAQPFGQWIVGLIGVLVIGVGLYQFKKAYEASFMEKYQAGKMDPTTRTWAERIGRFGLAARGVIFCMIGSFLIQAAVQAQPSETRGLSGALETLATQPYGPWLLGIVALGLVAYGLYCFSVARYRHFPTHG